MTKDEIKTLKYLALGNHSSTFEIHRDIFTEICDLALYGLEQKEREANFVKEMTRVSTLAQESGGTGLK